MSNLITVERGCESYYDEDAVYRAAAALATASAEIYVEQTQLLSAGSNNGEGQ